jgi:hypothetical protein
MSGYATLTRPTPLLNAAKYISQSLQYFRA